MYIENATWKSFGDAGIQPTVGGDVYALYDADHKWYRGRVEDIKSSRVSLLVLPVCSLDAVHRCVTACQCLAKIVSINVLYDCVQSQLLSAR